MRNDQGGLGTGDSCKPLRWKLLSANDVPTAEDEWIRSVVSPEAHERWNRWLTLPRYRVCHDFAHWAAVVVAFTDGADGGLLMALFSGNLPPFRATAFAVSRSDGRLYRLNGFPEPWNAGDGEHADVVALAVVAAVAVDADDVPNPVALTVGAAYVPKPKEWDDPARVQAWETVLADPVNWQPSQCAKSATSSLWPPELVQQQLDSDWDFTWYHQIGDEPALNARAPAEMRRTSRQLALREQRLSRLALTAITDCFRTDIVARAQAFGIGHVVTSALVYNWLCDASPQAPPTCAQPVVDSCCVIADDPLTRRLQAMQAAPLLLPLLLQATNEVELSTTAETSGSGTRRTHRAELDRVVDTGQPLYAYLSTACGISERTVRHLRQTPIRLHTLKPLFLPGSYANWRDFAASTLGFVRWLDALPVERWPQTVRRWRNWAEFIHAAQALFDVTRVLAIKYSLHPQHRVAMGVAADVREGIDAEVTADADADADADASALTHCDATNIGSNRIYRFAASPLAHEAARRWGRRPTNAADGHELNDHASLRMNVRELVQSIELVALGGVGDGDEELETLHGVAAQRMRHDAPFGVAINTLRGWTMEHWYEAGRQWHALWTPASAAAQQAAGVEVGLAANAEDSRTTDFDPSLCWLPLATVQALPDIAATLATQHERAVVWLVSSAALARDGAELSHCVASYDYHCMNQRDHVASIRDLRGVRQSTLRIQLRYEHSAWLPILVEHRGHKNGTPSAACTAAAATLMRALRGNHLQVVWERLELARKARYAERLRGNRAQRRQAVAKHLVVLEQVLPPGMAAALAAAMLPN